MTNCTTGQSSDAPVLSDPGTVVFEFPTSVPTDTVTLRPPTLGNEHSYQAERVYNQTRSGTQRVFRDPSWPSTESMKWIFEALTTSEHDDLKEFVKKTIAKEIKVTDYEGRVWHGVIINPGGAQTDELKECGWTFEIEFVGVLQ